MRAKPGIIKIAQLSGAPIVPVGAAVTRRRLLGSWDRFCLAWPFCRGVILVGEPINVPPGLSSDGLEGHRLELERQLNALTAEADRRCGHGSVRAGAARSTACAMRAPEFWSAGGWPATALAPFGLVYDLAGWARFRLTRPYDCGMPVLCVGNLVAGGAGKTPVAIELAGRLQASGFAVHFLTRGYGGRRAGPPAGRPGAPRRRRGRRPRPCCWRRTRRPGSPVTAPPAPASRSPEGPG